MSEWIADQVRQLQRDMSAVQTAVAGIQRWSETHEDGCNRSRDELKTRLHERSSRADSQFGEVKEAIKKLAADLNGHRISVENIVSSESKFRERRDQWVINMLISAVVGLIGFIAYLVVEHPHILRQ